MMNTRGERTLEVLNNLAKNCIEAEESYRKAAENIHDENLKQIFIIHAYQKAEYIAKLKAEIKRLGGKVLNFNYRNNDLELYNSDEHPTEILNTCENKEAKAIRNYEIAMNDDDLLWEVIPIVSRQYLETQESYNQIKYLKSNYTEAFAHF
ncbi:MAG: PA2169 family four-helix-bundle protein [Syntrophothermus sp.]|nr:PA2169 family four-helix-bundle protein [Ignavibacteriaceae bacterium]